MTVVSALAPPAPDASHSGNSFPRRSKFLLIKHSISLICYSSSYIRRRAGVSLVVLGPQLQSQLGFYQALDVIKLAYDPLEVFVHILWTCGKVTQVVSKAKILYFDCEHVSV